MDYRQTLLVLLSVLLCSSQGLTESSTEATLVQRPSRTLTETIPKSTPQENVSALLEMMKILNRRILEVTKTVIRHDEMNTRIMTRLDEMNSEAVKRFDEINSTMMTRLDEMNSESVKRFEENNSTMFSLFDKLDKKTLKKSEEMDNKLMKRLDEMNAETVKHLDEADLHVKSLEISITNSSEINQNKYLTLSQDMKKFSTKLDEMEARLQRQDISITNSSEINLNKYLTLSQDMKKLSTKLEAHLQEMPSYGKEKQFVLFTDERKTWQEAYDDCIKRNMMLASIESEEENNKVVSLLKTSDGAFWLSGTDLGHTGRYMWKSTGRDVTYSQWEQGQPDHYVHSDGEVAHCMFVYTGNMLWWDEWCSVPMPYICQH